MKKIVFLLCAGIAFELKPADGDQLPDIAGLSLSSGQDSAAKREKPNEFDEETHFRDLVDALETNDFEAFVRLADVKIIFVDYDPKVNEERTLAIAKAAQAKMYDHDGNPEKYNFTGIYLSNLGSEENYYFKKERAQINKLLYEEQAAWRHKKELEKYKDDPCAMQ